MTTTERTVTEDPIAAAHAAAEALKAKSLATIRPDQQRWDENQLAILRQLGVEDATQADVDLFFHYCRTTGLDPFRKQIYMIGRNTKVSEWVGEDGNRRKVDRWVTKYTIQTGIDGYRRNGREAAKRLGDTLSFDGPYWCGEDGEWKEVWPAKTPPVAAKYTVFRNGEPFTAVVHYDEFVQTNAIYEGTGQNKRKVGEAPNSMWDKMPRNQTGKCAEAMAYRRAYPDDFAGLVFEDAAQPTVIDQDGNIEREGTPPRTRTPGSNLRDRSRDASSSTEAPQDAEVVDAEPERPAGGGLSPASRKKWVDRLIELWSKADVANYSDQVTIATAILDGRQIDPSAELRDDDLKTIVTKLDEWSKSGETENQVREILNAAALVQANAEDAQS